MIRVVSWGTGEAGASAVRSILAHPDLELAGVYVARPERAGRDVGELLGIGSTGVITTNDREAFNAIECEVLAYWGAALDPAGPSHVIPFLESGRSVVTAAFPLTAPGFGPAAFREPLAAACERGGTALFTTGIEPGVCSDLLPMMLLSWTDGVRSVRVTEFGNYSKYAAGEVMKFMGFGARPDEKIAFFETKALLDVWSPVVHGLADHLGVALDEIVVETDRADTDRDVEVRWGTVRAGTVGAIRFQLFGMHKGEPLAVLEHVNYVDIEAARRTGWPLANESGMTYRCRLEGRPAMTCELHLDTFDDSAEEAGMVVTIQRAINAIPAIVDAPPGLVGPLDLPLLPSRNVLR